MNCKELVSQLTLEEKAGFCSGKNFWWLKAADRLGIPSVMVSDGPHGLRKQDDAADNLGINESIRAVCFPSAAGAASSFHRGMIRRLGETLGEECQAENLSILLGPAVNIKRSPLCGRNFEYFSEDPYLAGQMAKNYIDGVQSKNVGTSIKHFAVNNQETRRMTISAEVDERTLREIYLAGFETAVKEAKPWTVMCSYNKINGTYASENEWLLTDVLQKEWGFEGYVMTDWGACDDRVWGLKAGQALEMPASNGVNDRKIVEAVQNGELEEAVLDAQVERILEAVFRYTENRRPDCVFDREKDHETARKMAEECMVLLKNDQVLPLRKEQKVAFIGEFAKHPRYQGGGSSHINSYKVVSAWDALEDRKNVTFAQGYTTEKDEVDEAMVYQAVEAAKEAEVAVIFAGLPDSFESEGYDRKHMKMPHCQNVLIQEVCKVQPNTVVVLHNGSPVEMPWIQDVAGVLEAYLGGEAVGEAVLDILYGKVNPSGKLAETFPLRLEDTPCFHCFPGGQRTVEYREGLYVGYRYYDKAEKEVLFPFGYGLSYTSFEYSGLKCDRTKMTEKDSLTVTFTVKNTGAFDGAEAAQVYVADVDSSVYKAPKELKGFEKVFLKAGESKTVSVVLDPRAFAYYDVESHAWTAESGEYQILVGSSSRDIRLCASVMLDGAPEKERADDLQPYFDGSVQDVSQAAFQSLLGRECAPSEFEKGHVFDLNSTLMDAKDTKWGKRILSLIRKVMSKTDTSLGSGDMLFSSVSELPIRSMITMSQGALSTSMAEGLLTVLNGQGTLKGFWKILKGLPEGLKQGKKML